MIALATPFGDFIANGVKSTTQGLFDTSYNALEAANVPGLNIKNEKFENENQNNGGDAFIENYCNTCKTTCEKLCPHCKLTCDTYCEHECESDLCGNVSNPNLCENRCPICRAVCYQCVHYCVTCYGICSNPCPECGVCECSHYCIVCDGYNCCPKCGATCTSTCGHYDEFCESFECQNPCTYCQTKEHACQHWCRSCGEYNAGDNFCDHWCASCRVYDCGIHGY